MKIIFVSIHVFLLSILAVNSVQAIRVSDGFETGDLSTWHVSIEGATYYNGDGDFQDDVNHLPISIFEATPICASCGITPSIVSDNYHSAVQGERYLEIPGNSHSEFPFSQGGKTYVADLSGSTISVSMDLAMDTGDMLSGWMALYTTDYPPHNSDRAFVELSGAGVRYQPMQLAVMEAWGDDWGEAIEAEPHATPWTYWSWTAPTSGIFTLSLNNYMDDQEASFASYDAIELYHSVPEPALVLLLVFSFGGLIGLNKIKNEPCSARKCKFRYIFRSN